MHGRIVNRITHLFLIVCKSVVNHFYIKCYTHKPLYMLILVFLTLNSYAFQGEKGKNSVNDITLNNDYSKPLKQPPNQDYYEKNFLKFEDFVYQNNIKTVLFGRQNWEFSNPVLEFNSLEKLVLRFDDMDADFKQYAYTIIHCNALWQPSDLMKHEYIEGFYEDRINNYKFSRNTRVPYTHYHLEFPNENMKPLLPGNYLLKIFVEGDPETPVITKRFMIFQRKVTIDGYVKQAINLEHRRTHQEIDFTLITNNYRVTNPYRDITVVLTKNGRWDNAIYDLQPRLVQGNQLIYDYEDENIFPGGNEYRNFDIKSLRYRSMFVDQINSVPGGWNVYLRPDPSRQFLQYTFLNDINGRFLVATEDFQNDYLESDYARIHFTLPREKPLTNGNIYVLGELSLWNFKENNRMAYNYQDRQYELTMLLKQGFYDYVYAFLEDGSNQADITLFEGSHSETENDYAIWVYHREPGEIFDRLVGVSFLNSAVE